MSLPAPFYQDEAVTLYHGNVVKYHTCPRKQRGDTALGCAARLFRTCRRVSQRATSNHRSMLRNALSTGLNITHGWATTCPKRVAALVRCGDSGTSGRAGHAVQSRRSVTISTAIPEITNRPISPSSVGVATWRRMVA